MSNGNKPAKFGAVCYRVNKIHFTLKIETPKTKVVKKNTQKEDTLLEADVC